MIEELTAKALAAALPELAALLEACVADGASIGFLHPMPPGEAEGWWRGLEGSLCDGSRRVLVARQEGRILGTGALALAGLPNGRHRAEVSKLMVHPAARRRGIARALMLALEGIAAAEGRTLLVLDTKTGDAGEPLYRGLGWREAGAIPGYALRSGGGVDATMFYYKAL
ncbi:GNAT family N-acetyltransferase [Pseudoroseomonas rhizosphaerae]|uniref:GNAT family N-acetyltransferase n=1 Tax=Teichococcus rhizosphaerae TaxID=1335062 RepID=A0A2C7A3W6_9PROT|nr:GNAT family N-acetyltransferase [Pseudoroseomonas rhizosphaerae]PHK94758.1 GNAT family N-acetyltransferase [Pseudoroseomonas rhizosphaerae]